MIQDYLYVTVLVSFPEAFFMLLIGFNLSNYRDIKISKFVIIAAIQAMVALAVRVLGIYLGIHTLIQLISLYILVILFLKIKFYKAIIPTLIGMLAQSIIQSMVFTIVAVLGAIQLDQIYYMPRSAVLLAIPVFILSTMLLIFIKRKNFFLFDIND